MGNPHRDRQRRQQRDHDYQNNSFGDAFQRRYGSMDVSIEGAAPRGPPPDRHDRGRPERGEGRPRQKLDFREVASFEQGDCRCRITAADGYHGPIYNFTVERQNRERTSRFFRDRDVEDLTGLIAQANDWIESKKT